MAFLGFSGVPGRVLMSQGSGIIVSRVLSILGEDSGHPRVPVNPQDPGEGFSRILREGSQGDHRGQ